MRRQFHQTILIASLLPASWLGMQAVHEFGHVAAAKLTGGEVARVVRHPMTISRTDLASNPAPLRVVWAGPILGCLLPLAGWGIAVTFRCHRAFLLRFFAGFCLVANGAYIAAGSLVPVGDAETMLRHGSPSWWLWAFGAATVPAGFWLWHRQGQHFGLGSEAREVHAVSAYACLMALLALAALGLVVDGG